jgi:hypothetical protein
MNWRCFFGHHDWEGLPRDKGCVSSRICLRCHQREVFVSVGGGWGGWEEVGEWQRRLKARADRRARAKRIADMTSGGAP